MPSTSLNKCQYPPVIYDMMLLGRHLPHPAGPITNCANFMEVHVQPLERAGKERLLVSRQINWHIKKGSMIGREMLSKRSGYELYMIEPLPSNI